jgi:ADP-ribosyl-[dinitrogen reductase] hydrolase
MIESFGFRCDNFANKLMDWGSSWILDEHLNRGVGMATRSAVEQMLSGTSWTESGQKFPTCGSAMRAAPIGLFYHCDLDLVSRYADLQSILTHSSRAARAGSIAIASGVALCFMGFNKGTILRMASDLSSRVDKEFADRLLWVGTLDLDPIDALRAIGNSPYVSDTVPAAFYCFAKFEPKDSIIYAANGGGDTDSIASMAGALAGAFYGSCWIPDRWLSCLEGKKDLETVAKRLEELCTMICRF